MKRTHFTLILGFVRSLPCSPVDATSKIGGGQVDVSVMVRPGSSPATYAPKPQQMAQLASAKIYFAVGLPFEQAWL
jgi:ABC-type Zn uptake system ZnuABC Zn-binding protein ZnuA